MADREVRVLILGDASSLQAATVKADANMANFETRLKSATVLSGEAGAAMGGLTGKASALNTLGFSPASAGLLGMTAGLGVAVELTKQMIDRSEQNEKAEKNLAQAYAANGISLQAFRMDIENFLTTNKRFISDEFEAKDAIAALTRAGFDQDTVMRLVNDALDLSVDKGISLTEATSILTKVEQGRFRGLMDLGISIKGVTAGNVDQIASQDRIKEALAELEVKEKDRRKTLSDTQQAQNDLNRSTDDFSVRYGPGMQRALANGLDILSLTIQLIDVLSNKSIPNLVSRVEHAFEGASPTATPGGDRGWLNEGGTQSSGGAPIPGHHGPGANIVIPVYGSNDPEATARAVARKLMAAFA